MTDSLIIWLILNYYLVVAHLGNFYSLSQLFVLRTYSCFCSQGTRDQFISKNVSVLAACMGRALPTDNPFISFIPLIHFFCFCFFCFGVPPSGSLMLLYDIIKWGVGAQRDHIINAWGTMWHRAFFAISLDFFNSSQFSISDVIVFSARV